MSQHGFSLPLSFQHLSLAAGVRAAMHRDAEKVAYRQIGRAHV